MLHNSCILGGPEGQALGENQKWLCHPCLLSGPKEGGIAISGMPIAKRGETIRSTYFTPDFSGAHKRTKVRPNPSNLGGPQRQARGQNQKWLSHLSLLGSPEEGVSDMQPLHPRGHPTPSPGIRSGCLTPAFPGAQTSAQVRRDPCILGGPQRQARRENQKSPSRPSLLECPEEGGTATPPLHSQGYPRPRTERKSDVATSPLSSRGPRRGRKGYITPAFSGVPNAKRGDKIASGYPTVAFSVAQKRAEVLRYPCILGGGQQQAQGQNQKWLPHPCLLRSPEEGGSATSPLHSRASPTPGAGRKPQVATSPLPGSAT